jgi:hypothetical protein
LHGQGAQEESLHRRSNLHLCLDDNNKKKNFKEKLYPIDRFGGIYTPNAIIIKSNEKSGYYYYDEPEKMSFVSVSGKFIKLK